MDFHRENKTTLSVFMILTGLSALWGPHSFAKCGEKERSSPIYKAFEECEERKPTVILDEINRSLSKATAHYCAPTLVPTSEKALSRLCKDPKGEVCKHQGKMVMTSVCKTTLWDPEKLANSPGFVSAKCDAEKTAEKIMKNGDWIDDLAKKDLEPLFQQALEKNIITQEQLDKSLPAYIHQKRSEPEFIKKIGYIQEQVQAPDVEKKIAGIAERQAIYTPEKLKTIETYFNQVKAKYIAMIKRSSMIPEGKKENLILRLTQTQIERSIFDHPENPIPPWACYNSGESGPLAGVMNGLNGRVYICSGIVASLNQMDPHYLQALFAHELTHSIDNCALEKPFFPNENVEPNAVLKTFPGLIECLRGGSGEGGCANSVLTCVTPKEHQERAEKYCRSLPAQPEESSGASKRTKLNDTYVNCLEGFKKTPNCDVPEVEDSSHHNHVNVYHPRDFGAFRDQTGEALSDFMAAGVVGELVKEEQLSDLKKADALLAITQSWRLDSAQSCHEETNRQDEHPPMYLRINRVIMSNRIFRESLGCMEGPPQTKSAGISCPAL